MVIIFREDAYLYYPSNQADFWIEPSQDEKVQNVNFALSSGDTIHGWWITNNANTPAVLFLHGNAGNLSSRHAMIRYLLSFDPSVGSVLIVDYPGYGKSTGAPSEKLLFETGRRAFDLMTGHFNIPEQKVIVFGRSLGASVALHTALSRNCAAVILECPFLSIPRMASEVFPFLPGLGLLSRQRYDNETMIQNLDVPILIIHGQDDSVIPFNHGQRLYNLASEPKYFFAVPQGNHDDNYIVDASGYRDSWISFLNTISPE